ncbi:MAG TPA: bifunctional 4-hydroxy-2-oxoglutarate aldolase/2-dehydro-3-deoxy-phosphogluconate aldolase [Candidatus Hydrogenedentes bacterium]|nr:bifunctional 4-hydroxy-2-oxoglutarate aldolase/2-dehydro-3-deoxy-phosphogluconate aldolase [Candidatus Hydrogenedentota bacterium]
MDKQAIHNYLTQNGIIAIVRADSSDGLVRTVEAVMEGGVRCIEVTMTTPGALACIEAASKTLTGADVCLGVGSVLDGETARLAILAGAQYIVCPITSQEIILMAHRYGKPCMPGAYTPTEIYNAWVMGGDIIKVFPASCGGLDYIKAVRAPLPQIPVAPTGGVDLNNLADFVKAGVAAVGVGSNLVSKKMIEAQDFKGLAENARRYAEAFKAARDAR